jgi:translation elongation factor EF-1beta
MEAQLQALGDPSGRQDATYWDAWFDVVHTHNAHQAFEWYTSCNEVLRVLRYHVDVSSSRQDASSGAPRRMLHPGAGTSLLPLHLAAHFPQQQQVVVDISAAAIHEMKVYHDNAPASAGDHHHNNNNNGVAYAVADLLQPPLPYDDGSFDGWIDKGFVDAIFAKDTPAENRRQAGLLFAEAHRVLTAPHGIMLMVSLAEAHSLDLILDHWLHAAADEDDAPGWSVDLHVWELVPVSGTMRPFGLVLTKGEAAGMATARGALPADDDAATLWFHTTDGRVEELTRPPDLIAPAVAARLGTSRDMFQKAALSTAAPPTRELLATLDVKPMDDETDLALLASRIQSMSLDVDSGDDGIRRLRVQWVPAAEETAAMFQRVPIGFGLSKIVVRCRVAEDDLDHVVALVQDRNDELVQSVDVNWDATFPIAALQDILPPHP